MRINSRMTLVQSSAIESLVTDIRALNGTNEELINRFQQIFAPDKEGNHQVIDKNSSAFWIYRAYEDSLVRIRLFLEQNFNYIESMGILAVTRYIYELTVWLKLMQKDTRYGYIYHHELIKDQVEYYKKLSDQLIREVDLFRKLAEQEKNLAKERIKEAIQISDVELRKKAMSGVPQVMKEIDRIADRKFSIHGHQAQINGYSYEAYRVEAEALPAIRESLKELERELIIFEQNVDEDIKTFLNDYKKHRQWKERSKLTDMHDEYNFIYSYTSRLLHANPASLTTNYKNLEPDEIIMFLRYVHVRLLDIMDMASQQLITVGI